MNKGLIAFFAILNIAPVVYNRGAQDHKPGFRNTVIEMVNPAGLPTNPNIQYAVYESSMYISWKPVTYKSIGQVAKWTISTDKPIFVNLIPVMGKNMNADLFVEPGDSIHIEIKDGEPVYSGRNVDKLVMLWQMNKCEKRIPLPSNKLYNRTISLEDYIEWSNYLDAVEANMDSVFMLYKNQISPAVYDYLRADKLSEVEYMRLIKFWKLQVKLLKEKESGAGNILSHVFDATASNAYAQWLHAYPGKVGRAHYFYDFARRSAERKYNFNMDHPALEHLNRKLEYLSVARNIYRNDIMQGFLVFLLAENGIMEFPDSRMIDSLLADFYAQPGYPAYKNYLREYEKERREAHVVAGKRGANFLLMDKAGKAVSLNTFNGKVVLIDFQGADCNDCAEMSEELDKAGRFFEKDTNLVRVSVLPGLDNGRVSYRFSDANHIYLHAGSSTEQEFIRKHYNILSYPGVFLLDHEGRLVYDGGRNRFGVNPFPDPRKDSGNALSDTISKLLQFTKDGPYVMYHNETAVSYTLEGKSIIKRRIGYSGDKVAVATDQYNETFSVQLKKNKSVEPSRFPQPEKLFILSDIEGNFSAFKKLLTAGGIMDNSYNWTFGNGHLVIAGDMFDRGKQVTECLWLIYSLEEKAKAAGGYVHFILGNHEIMNLNQDTRYAAEKYLTNADLLGISYKELYGTNSELGAWLRTKNIMEKIGDFLFVHGGISRELNEQPLTIDQINALARKYYADDTNARHSHDEAVRTIFSPNTSPFWLRGYYSKNKLLKLPETVVDSTLKKFSVSRIITGHTIIASTVTSDYGGKVINTDTRHAEGDSEALLIENNHYYRVDNKGKRMPFLY